MIVWMLVSVVMVVGMKFFTATKMRDLERRLNRVKDGLHTRKVEFDSAKSRQYQISSEEELHSERIRFMKELIQDIQIRLMAKDEPNQSLMLDSR